MRLLLLLALAFISSAGAIADLTDLSPGLLASVRKHYGSDAVARLDDWQKLVRELKAGESNGKLQRISDREQPMSKSSAFGRVNLFFNKVPYKLDQDLWGVPDYWATPVEMLAANGGDCEDYAIAKYLTLKELGVPIERLRITYVRAITLGISHMVLAYYPTPDAEPWILDSLTGDIARASARKDLEPVFSFNDDDVWSGTNTVRKSSAIQIRLWKNLLEKLEQERQL